MTLTLAVYCHHFEHRFCWMLSSLLQQKPNNVELVVDAGYMRGTGSPECGEVLEFFKEQGMIIKHTAYDKSELETFQKRGFVRNRQLAECTTDWIWFADCDMTIHPDFLETFDKVVSGLTAEDKDMMLTCARYSTEKPPDSTNSLVAEHDYPCVVPDAYKRASVLPKKLQTNIGAGYCQIARVANVRENHGGIYVRARGNRDFNWDDRYWKTCSDKQFRRKLGRKRIPLPAFTHLQHYRDNEIGHHIEVQR